jgi:predicted nucleic acid-binding protein
MLAFVSAEDDRNKVVSALAQLEARSGICRLRQERLITPAEAASAVASISAEMRRMIEQPINPPVIEAANTLIDKHYLRALDAVQLGSAIVARDLLAAPDMRLVASDKDLLKAARKEGFAIWNPMDSASSGL